MKPPSEPTPSPLTVITTHINADFDAFASMLAAKKLYPDALVVFPGSQERNLRDFFVKSMVYMYDIVKIKDVNLERINRLVLVDVRQAGRIGKFSEILGRPGLEIHVYDHHPPMADDVSGNVEICEMTGATVTIMVRLLRERNIDITADEATIMALGLYEDTGSFTFSSTTKDDFLAAAYLLSKGANLNLVANMVSREMSPEQVNLLNDMIENVGHHTINGIHVVVTRVSSETYVPDFALLVHKLRDMENLDVIFALGMMENRIYLVARSRLTEVDVGDIAAVFEGGGHASAAAATIKNQTLIQVEEKLLSVLEQRINPARSAEDLMSSPAIHVTPTISLQEANDILTRYNVNVLVVVEADTVVGTISRQVIEKGLHHKLAHIPVREYMTTEFNTVSPEASLSEVQEKIIGNKQRLLPVTQESRLTGVITRTDLLNVLVGDSIQAPEYVPDTQKESAATRPRQKNVKNVMRERLPDHIVNLLMTIGQVAESLKYRAYAVGGFVRDIFLYQENLDIDVVIEGDGIRFAKELAASLNGRVRSHKKFRTAVVVLPDGLKPKELKIDVATARIEYYQSPGALPTVETGSIKLDLYRRDFSINTLAIKLNPDKFGILIDFFGGQKDLKDRAIRVLHNLSFVEDPTRIFRAIRFEQRFGFKIAKLTSGLIENAVRMGFLKQLSGRRLFSELRLILEEEKPVMALRRLDEFGLLEVIHPDLHFDQKIEALLLSAEKVLTWHKLLFLDDVCRRWMVYLLVLERPLGRNVAEGFCRRLELNERDQKILVHQKTKADKCLKWLGSKSELRNSTLYENLKAFDTECLLYMMASTSREATRRAISKYFTTLRPTTTILKGKDLQALGLKPGPIYRKILQNLLDARLDHRIKTREEELAYVRENWLQDYAGTN